MTEELLVEGIKRNANHIKSVLAERGMTQVELAKLLEANPQVLNKAIQGDMSPRSLELRKRINKVLGI
ncbi:helix-turn-helix domain-containing protein [Levilactobacillus brevis]|uniref:helix-turn-helix domain-containing protein n=1 Tax=Levilactobacillus brevis TaxID=1580 RepID=UPI002072FA7B|nr:helix-turn-helix domain-containing protein [Levilactobacillus brevis]